MPRQAKNFGISSAAVRPNLLEIKRENLMTIVWFTLETFEWKNNRFQCTYIRPSTPIVIIATNRNLLTTKRKQLGPNIPEQSAVMWCNYKTTITIIFISSLSVSLEDWSLINFFRYNINLNSVNYLLVVGRRTTNRNWQTKRTESQLNERRHNSKS